MDYNTLLMKIRYCKSGIKNNFQTCIYTQNVIYFVHLDKYPAEV